MGKRRIMITSLVVLIILLAFVVIRYLFWPSPIKEQIQVGYETNDETQQIVESKNILERNDHIIINVVLKEMVEKPKKVPIELTMIQAKTNKKIFKESREEFEGLSGFEIKFDATKIDSGDYSLKLFRDNKLIESKKISFK